MPCPLPNEALMEITQDMWPHQTDCLDNALEYLGWKVEFLLGRKPPKCACVERAEIDS